MTRQRTGHGRIVGVDEATRAKFESVDGSPHGLGAASCGLLGPLGPVCGWRRGGVQAPPRDRAEAWQAAGALISMCSSGKALRQHIYIYIWSYMVTPPPRAYLCPLLVEGVNSTLCASFLQMPKNTVKYSVFVLVLPSIWQQMSDYLRLERQQSENGFRFQIRAWL